MKALSWQVLPSLLSCLGENFPHLRTAKDNISRRVLFAGATLDNMLCAALIVNGPALACGHGGCVFLFGFATGQPVLQEKGAQFDGVLWKKNLIYRLKEHRQIYSTILVTLCDYQGHVCVFGSESRWNGTDLD